MYKRKLSLFLISVLLLTLLTGCGGKKSSIITAEEAQKIALQTAGYTQAQVDDIHTHVGTHEGNPCYNIHITVGDEEFEILIDAQGNVLE